MEIITIQISVEEANVILAALGQQPYLQVADLIKKIQEQGASQLEHKYAGPPKDTEVVTVTKKSV
jgi:hypothetical protein